MRWRRRDGFRVLADRKREEGGRGGLRADCGGLERGGVIARGGRGASAKFKISEGAVSIYQNGFVPRLAGDEQLGWARERRRKELEQG